MPCCRIMKFSKRKFCFLPLIFGGGGAGRNNSVGISTLYGLDDTGIESLVGGGCGARFFSSVQIGPCGPPSLLYNEYRVFPGVKGPGRGVDQPPLSSAEVEGRVELYIRSPSGPSWPVIG
jgi:hypothetical protein